VRDRGELQNAAQQMEQIKAEARGWAAQVRAAARGTVQRLVAEVDEVKREWSHVASSSAGLQSQVRQLEVGRRELQAQLLRMVPRTELADAMAELERERVAKAALKEQLDLALQQNKALVLAAEVNREIEERYFCCVDL
jgi:hypothetical protein